MGQGGIEAEERLSERDVVRIGRSDDPRAVVAAAVHDGSYMRPDLAGLSALSAEGRYREEDPHTGRWADLAPLSFVGLRSRFEFDLNRPRESAVYRHPADAWGLHLWNAPLPESCVAESLRCYDRFYDVIRSELDALEQQRGPFVMLDLHTYNHRRAGPHQPPADPEANPEVNIGTGTLDRRRWGSLVDAALDCFARHGFDARENVRFQGGHFSRWIHSEFPQSGCCLAIEFKKFFMDEWTGELDPDRHAAIGDAIRELVEISDRFLRTLPPDR